MPDYSYEREWKEIWDEISKNFEWWILNVEYRILLKTD
jgi:hypothetical protein